MADLKKSGERLGISGKRGVTAPIHTFGGRGSPLS
jgi:hypothetical protein